jgi:hypothetical protein
MAVFAIRNMLFAVTHGSEDFHLIASMWGGSVRFTTSTLFRHWFSGHIQRRRSEWHFLRSVSGRFADAGYCLWRSLGPFERMVFAVFAGICYKYFDRE